MEYFGDSVYAWDVVNEAVSDESNHIYRQDSPWYTIIGEDYLKIAFEKAHQINPDAKLFYNDYNAVNPGKRDRIIELLSGLIEDGVPVDGMGIQGHTGVGGTGIEVIEESIQMYADLGLDVEITELDVGREDYSEEKQAERYRDLFALFKENSDKISNVTIWGIADDETWRPDEHPLLFNENQEPKPACWAVVDPSKPWFVNKAEHSGAVIFKNNEGEELGKLVPGTYEIEDNNSRDFELDRTAQLKVEKRHLITFYESDDFQGDSWSFTSTEEFEGKDIFNKAKSFKIEYIEINNIAQNKTVEASAKSERAKRAIDGNESSSWSPDESAPYWLTVDLEEPHLLNRWVVKLFGSGKLGEKVSESPLNASDFKLQISEDRDNWTDVDVVEDNTASKTDRDLAFVEARYVRLYVTNLTSVDFNDELKVYEFEIYGQPVD